MGVKVIHTIFCLTAASGAIFLLGLWVPQHTISFFSLYGVRVARMWTYIASVKFETSGNDFCAVLQKMSKGKTLSWCDNLDTMTDLQEFQQRMCSPVFAAIWPSFCDGLQWAYAIGALLTIAVLTNLIMQVASMYLLMDYGRRKANPAYRKAALILLASGLVFMMIVLALYAFLALVSMSDIQSSKGQVFSMLLSASQGTGFSHGYVLLWLGVLFQLVAVWLFGEAKRSRAEDKLVDEKFQRAFEEEARHLEYGAFAPPSTDIPLVQPQQQHQSAWVQQPGAFFGHAPDVAGQMDFGNSTAMRPLVTSPDTQRRQVQHCETQQFGDSFGMGAAVQQPPHLQRQQMQGAMGLHPSQAPYTSSWGANPGPAAATMGMTRWDA